MASAPHFTQLMLCLPLWKKNCSCWCNYRTGMDYLAAVYQPCSVLFIVHQSAKRALTPEWTNPPEFLTVKSICTPLT